MAKTEDTSLKHCSNKSFPPQMHAYVVTRSSEYLLNLCRGINGYLLHDLQSQRKKEQIFHGSLGSYRLRLPHSQPPPFTALQRVEESLSNIHLRNPKHCRDHTAARDESASHALTYLLNVWKKFQLQSTHKRHVAWLYLDGIVYEEDDLHTRNDLSSYFAYITETTWNMWPASQGRIIPLFLLCHVQPHYLAVKAQVSTLVFQCPRRAYSARVSACLWNQTLASQLLKIDS